MNKPTAYELADEIRRAKQRAGTGSSPRKPRRSDFTIISRVCEICGKTHKLALGPARCTGPGPALPSAAAQVSKAIFGKALAAALLLGCMAVSGCAHFYVSGVYAKPEITDTSKDMTVGITISPNPYSYKAVIPLSSTAK